MIARRHRRRPRACAGFTLLEVLVVLLIIGVVISFAALSIGRADNAVEEEAERLAALIRLGSEEAVLQGRELAIEFNTDGYRFLAFDGEQWLAIVDDELLRPRTLPFDVAVDLAIEGEPLQLQAETDAEDGERRTPPRIFLLSSGEMSPFELVVHKSGAGGGYRINGGSRGELLLKGVGDGS